MQAHTCVLKTELEGGLISGSNMLLKTLMEGVSLISGSNFLQSSKLSGKMLALYLSALTFSLPKSGLALKIAVRMIQAWNT